MGKDSQKVNNKQQNSLQEEHKPEEFIVNPLLSIHNEIDDLNVELSRLNKVSDSHSKLLNDILKREGELLKELKDIRDEGGKATFNGAAVNTSFTIIDTNRDPGHKVKSAVVTNNGPDTLFAGEDAALSPQLDADLIDVVSDQTRFVPVFPGESERFAYNVRSIRSIHLLSDPNVAGATSNFRVRLAW